MRRTPGSPSRRWIAAQSAPMDSPARVARRQQRQRGGRRAGGLIVRDGSHGARAPGGDARGGGRRWRDRAAGRGDRPIGRRPRARASPAVARSRRRRLRRSRRDAPCGCRTGSSGRARAAAGGGGAAPRRTWRRPGAWWCRGCGCRPSAPPSDRDRLGPPRRARSKRRPLSGVFCVCPMADSTLPFRSGSPTRQGSATAP